ncbi:MAG: tripartite tricarboxylate transporter substrate binding protein [Thermodesulfobacteriota bacterium]
MKAIFLKPKAIFFLCFVLVFLFGRWGYAQEDVTKFPSHPITYIVCVPPGGPTDLMHRVLAKEAEKFLKQPIVVVNKPGGALMIGSAAITSAEPDGYTVGHYGAGSQLLVPLLEKVPFHPMKDLVPIIQFSGSLYFGIGGKGDSPYKSFKDLVVYARQNPKKLTFGTTGANSWGFFLTEYLARIEKVQFTHIPFKGTAEVEPAILGGHIDFGAGDFSYPLVESGQIRLYLLFSEIHNPARPEIPLLKELYGIPMASGMSVGTRRAVHPGILAKLEDAFTRATKEPSFISGMKKIDMPIIYRNQKDADKFYTDMFALFEKMIKDIGVTKK